MLSLHILYTTSTELAADGNNEYCSGNKKPCRSLSRKVTISQHPLSIC